MQRFYEEFLNILNHIYNENYNPLDMSDDTFMQDFIKFTDYVSDIDKRLACVFRNEFENCWNLDSFFRVFFLNNVVTELCLYNCFFKYFNLYS